MRLDTSVLSELLACDGYPFVRRAYWALLNREPDPGGLAHYLEQLRRGTSKLRVLRELAQSPESEAKGVLLLPDLVSAAVSPSGTQHDTAHVASTWKQLLGNQGRGFIVCAYQTVLGRAPDPDGEKFYLEQLRGGCSKVQVLAQLRHSAECKRRKGGNKNRLLLRRLDWEIIKFWMTCVPLVGWFLKTSLGIEGNSALDRRLRRIEYMLLQLGREDMSAEVKNKDVIPTLSDKLSVSEDRAATSESPARRAPHSVVSAQTTPPAAPSLSSLPTPINWI